MKPVSALLLDLDGTLLDTAPEMAATLNVLLREEKRDPLPFELIRPTVSHGSIGMVQLAFGDATADEFERLRVRFLDLYRTMLGSNTQLFAGFDTVFDYIEKHGLAWGIVTNKPAWLTDPLLEILQLHPTNCCAVSGDTVAERKPHPLPLLHAAGILNLPPERCLFVGDAERDITAGKAAGMMTLVAQWGYLGQQDEPDQWQADGTVREPADLISWLIPRAAGKSVS